MRICITGPENQRNIRNQEIESVESLHESKGGNKISVVGNFFNRGHLCI